MIIRKEIEINVCHAEVDKAMMEAAPLDQISLMIRMARTITQKDVDEIRELMGDASFKDAVAPLRELVKIIGE